jgi:hypothetical protein
VANHVDEPTTPKTADKYGGGQWERWRLLYSGMKPYCGDVDTLHSAHVAAQYQVRAYNTHGWGHWSHVLTVDRGTTHTTLNHFPINGSRHPPIPAFVTTVHLSLFFVFHVSKYSLTTRISVCGPADLNAASGVQRSASLKPLGRANTSTSPIASITVPFPLRSAVGEPRRESEGGLTESIQPSESQTKLRVNVDGAFGTKDGLSLYSKTVGFCEMVV